MDEKNNKIDRRDFLKKSFAAVIAGTAILSAFDIKNLIASAADDYAESSSPTPKTISLDDYPDLQSVNGYIFLNDKVIVIRTGQTKFIALSLICSHKQCTVDYDGSSFECPCHGSTYSKSGKVTNGPATKNLKSYATTLNTEDNTLTINL
jgi:cytochrome b6-f complex iron-sulfur subunit